MLKSNQADVINFLVNLKQDIQQKNHELGLDFQQNHLERRAYESHVHDWIIDLMEDGDIERVANDLAHHLCEILWCYMMLGATQDILNHQRDLLMIAARHWPNAKHLVKSQQRFLESTVDDLNKRVVFTEIHTN